MTHIFWRKSRYGLHITKFPVMSSHSIFNRQMKSQVSMVAGVVGFMNQGWTLIRSQAGIAMAGQAVLSVNCFAGNAISDKALRRQV